MIRTTMRAAARLAALAAVAGLSWSCGFGLLSEPQYDYETKGPPAMLVDDFEQHDGTMSTRYLYGATEDSWGESAKVSSSWSYSGSYSLYLSAPVTVEVDLPADLLLSYVTSSSSSTATLSSLCALYEIDGVDYDSSGGEARFLTMDGGYYVYQVSLPVPKGDHVLTLGDHYYSFVIDDLSVGLYVPLSTGEEALAPQNAVCDWEDIEGASGYSFEASLDEGFSSVIARADGLSASAYTVPATVDWTTLYWRVGVSGLADDMLWSLPVATGRAYSAETETFADASSVERWKISPDYPSSFEISQSTSSGHSGSSSLRIYTRGGTTGYVETRVYLASAGTISFWFSCQYSYKFGVLIDGVSQTDMQTSTWTNYTTPSLSSGYHTLRFVNKNGYYSNLYIDDLIVP